MNAQKQRFCDFGENRSSNLSKENHSSHLSFSLSKSVKNEKKFENIILFVREALVKRQNIWAFQVLCENIWVRWAMSLFHPSLDHETHI